MPNPTPPSDAFRYFLRVRYQECDAQHVVFNARYGDYADLSCFEFMRAALPKASDAFDGTFEMQTVKQLVEWTGPARFDDVLECSIWASRFGTTSFDLTCSLRRAYAGETEPKITITTTYVHVDNKTWTKKPVPPHMREALEHGARGQATDHAGYFERSDKPAKPRGG
jgi:acyl-CoA thioester hydrolase